MRDADNYMVLEVPSLRENVALVRVVVAAFAARLPFTITELEELKVAVSEAVTNAVVHAYPGGVGPVRTEAHLAGEELVVSISDEGCGLPAPDERRHPTDQETTGMGFSFIESFTDAFSVAATAEGGTRVSMRKRPARGSEPG